MSWALAGGMTLLAVGALAGAPALLLVGLLLVTTAFLRTLWTRHGLRGVTYERRLIRDRAVWGDDIALDVVVWNRKLLPLAWLQAEDFVSDTAIVRERPLEGSERPGQSVLVNRWTLAWYERVVRHYHLVADHRGVFSFDSVRLTVADLFARDTASTERSYRQTYIVRPRTVPVRHAAPDRAPIGSRRASHSLFHDPALFAGVRPYQPGDPIRQLHWKATARTGRPVSKRFDPSREREIVIALDIQTVEGPHWRMVYDEGLVESLCVAAASLARSAIADGAACGLAIAGYTATPRPIVHLAPSAGPGQLARITDALGRLSPFASAPFEGLLASLAVRVPPGATIMSLSSRDPVSYLPALQRLARSGFAVRHVALGPDAQAATRRIRAAGIVAAQATLAPDWRSADALVVAG